MESSTRGGWFRRLFSRSMTERLDPTRTDLVIVASSFDDAESCTAAFDRGVASEPRFLPEFEVVLRHHLLLPENTLADAHAVAAQDGYEPGSGVPAVAPEAVQVEEHEGVPLILQRVQILDALHCSQERSRMAGLAQRRGGTVLGWDLLQPARVPGVAAD